MRAPPEVRLRSCVTLEKGKPPAAQPYYGPDADRYLTPEYLRTGGECALVKAAPRSARVEDGGTILLWDGSNAGEVLCGHDGILASTMSRASHAGRFDDAYFFYALKQWEPYLKAQTSGSGIPHVDKEIFGNLAITEFDLREQSKIAEVLSTVDRAIKQTETLIAKQQRIRTGLMQDLLTRGIDEHGNLRSEETHEFKDSPLGRISAEWDILPLGELAAVDRGKFTHRPRNDPRFYGGDFPFIQTGDVTSRTGRVVNSYSQTLNHRGTLVSKCFPAGTIAVTIAANIADSVILGLPMYFPDSIVGAIVKRSHCIRFVELMIRRWKPILERRAPQSAQKNINLETLRPLAIPTPPPKEQERIGALYDSVDTVQEMTESHMRKLCFLKTALMQDLLTGKVRVMPLLEQGEGTTA